MERLDIGPAKPACADKAADKVSSWLASFTRNNYNQLRFLRLSQGAC
jgi:hypothetical protein